MQITFERAGKYYAADLNTPIDLSIPLRAGLEQVNCFWAPPIEYNPVKADGFTGSTAEGGVVNFFNIRINPHGNGTHTECVGHIAKEPYRIAECLQVSHVFAKLISLYPQRIDDGDRVLTKVQLADCLQAGECEALILRTLPNDAFKLRTQYSGSNPPYIDPAAIAYMVECGVQHLLLDLPSVDREQDGGQLLAHKAFWRYPGAFVRTNCTITELIYVPNAIKDGYFLLDIQIAPFDLDASPSRPLIFATSPMDS